MTNSTLSTNGAPIAASGLQDSFALLGRVLLAGDAAHLNNPLGGFGMNAGVHDVWNLKDKLIAILRDDGDADALLDRYERQRRASNLQFVQAQTIANKKALEDQQKAMADQQKQRG